MYLTLNIKSTKLLYHIINQIPIKFSSTSNHVKWSAGNQYFDDLVTRSARHQVQYQYEYLNTGIIFTVDWAARLLDLRGAICTTERPSGDAISLSLAVIIPITVSFPLEYLTECL